MTLKPLRTFIPEPPYHLARNKRKQTKNNIKKTTQNNGNSCS